MARATIDDVARRAGVTKSTVSHALSGKRSVSQETRRRIEEAIIALGYRPNPVARRLAAGRSGTIGFVYPLFETGDITATAVISAAAGVVSEAGFAFVLFAQPRTDSLELRSFLQSGLLDGVVITTVQMADQRVEALRDAGTSFVMIGRTANNSGLNFVDIDVDAAVEDCVEHLAVLGHKRLAFLRSEVTDTASSIRSVQAYERACARRRLGIQVVSCPLAAPAVRESAANLFRQQPGVTAVVATGDMLAYGTLQAARELGRRVPGDLSLICLGKTWVSDSLGLGTTGVDLRTAEQARAGCALLLDLLGDEPSSNTQVLLEPRWEGGDTTGPAP